jgi:hypothetical protein
VKFKAVGENEQDATAGSPPQLSSTEPKPLAVGVTVTVNIPFCPCLNVADEGLTARLKPAGGGGGVGTPAYSYTPISMIALLSPFAF